MEKQSKIAEALNKAQTVMGAAKKDKKNPFFKSSYADLSSVFDAIHYPFASNGLSISQIMDVLDNGRMILITKLMHTSGEYLESKMILPDIADPQKLGSSITYFRRYSLMAISGLPAEDDDGNEASRAIRFNMAKEAALNVSVEDSVIDAETFLVLDEYLNGHEELRTNLKKICGVDDLRNIKQSQLESARKYTKAYLQRKEKSEEKSITSP